MMHFEKTREKSFKETLGDYAWERWDGYEGRYSVCISTHKSGYRYIQIFTYRDTANAVANKYAPDMYIIEEDVTPVGVRINFSSVSERDFTGDADGIQKWADICSEMEIAFSAAKEIREKFCCAK